MNAFAISIYLWIEMDSSIVFVVNFEHVYYPQGKRIAGRKVLQITSTCDIFPLPSSKWAKGLDISVYSAYAGSEREPNEKMD